MTSQRNGYNHIAEHGTRVMATLRCKEAPVRDRSDGDVGRLVGDRRAEEGVDHVRVAV
eukprot:CAMPEP_0179851626 /NCGR_PEP_ID=MMETSP0982-20121206/8353_1 /TAXON_ID=483367 /ORGANISM="non described non described, Strain CCMP 2436" /LENGTH=57 /DNA_ID=CAMNT_0021737163 /DNA_START=285 /DNA_END=456 /DNA_ORIENTATION=+